MDGQTINEFAAMEMDGWMDRDGWIGMDGWMEVARTEENFQGKKEMRRRLTEEKRGN